MTIVNETIFLGTGVSVRMAGPLGRSWGRSRWVREGSLMGVDGLPGAGAIDRIMNVQAFVATTNGGRVPLPEGAHMATSNPTTTTPAPTTDAPTPARGAATTAAGLLLLRVVTGLVMVVHGWQKFFVDGLSGVSAFFGAMGIPLAGVSAAAVATIELVGGALLIAGLATRVVAALFAAAMVGAIMFVHAANGFLAAGGGYEFVLLLAAVGAALALTGGGRFAVDALIRR
jgi:putative oxidoreductase